VEHSIFALPFALSAAMLAAAGWPSWHNVFWIVVCMVTARSAAMAFNRWADASLDAANPRTAARAIPAGLLSRSFVGGFTVVMSLAFVLAAAQLNHVTLLLSPVVLACSCLLLHQEIYPLVPPGARLALGLLPQPPWIAIRGSLDPRIVVLTAQCCFGWVDSMFSTPARTWPTTGKRPEQHTGSLGIRAAFWFARAMHLVMMILLCWLLSYFRSTPSLGSE